MISIGTPYITKSDKAAYLRAKVHISDNTAKRYLQKTSTLINCAWLTEVDYPPAIWNDPDCNLWFSVPAEYADHLCCERSNAFVIVMLWYAMVTGSDISFEAPISERLYNGLTQNLIPARVCRFTSGLRHQLKTASPGCFFCSNHCPTVGLVCIAHANSVIFA